jgi:predicted  nucleic acid-binding Zn-ribbon protein
MAAVSAPPMQRQVAPMHLSVVSKASPPGQTKDPAVETLQHTVKAVEAELQKAKERWEKPQIDMTRLADQMYRELTKRMRFEQQRRGL